MNRELFERDLWKLSEICTQISDNVPTDLTADELIEIMAVARRLERIVVHRSAITQTEKAESELSVRGRAA